MASIRALLTLTVLLCALPVVAQPTDSHTRMLSVLEEIRQSTDQSNPWLGAEPARAARRALQAALAKDAPLDQVWGLHLALAEEELRLGKEQSAIESFETAYSLLRELGDRIGQLFCNIYGCLHIT